MIDREKLLDELARVFARAAVDALIAEQASERTKAPVHDSGASDYQHHVQDTNSAFLVPPRAGA